MTARPSLDQAQSQAVPLLDLKAQYEPIESEIMEAIRGVCASQKFILGAHTEELEKKIAEYSQCRFGIGVSSGTEIESVCSARIIHGLHKRFIAVALDDIATRKGASGTADISFHRIQNLPAIA